MLCWSFYLIQNDLLVGRIYTLIDRSDWPIFVHTNHSPFWMPGRRDGGSSFYALLARRLMLIYRRTSLRLLDGAVETCGEEDALVARAAAGDDGEDLGRSAAPSNGVGVGVYERCRGVVVA